MVRLPVGWRLRQVTAERGAATYTVDNDRASRSALVARLDARCDVTGDVLVSSGDPRVRRFREISAGSGLAATWRDLFPGGCLTVRMHPGTGDAEVNAQVSREAPLILGFVSRSSLVEALRNRSDGRLRARPGDEPMTDLRRVGHVRSWSTRVWCHQRSTRGGLQPRSRVAMS